MIIGIFSITRLFRDGESLESFHFPVESMFKDVPKTGRRDDYIQYTLEQMDKHGIERGLIGVSERDETAKLALKRHPDRFIPSCGVEIVRDRAAQPWP